MDLLSALPEDIFNQIATYLDGKDVLASSLVCKEWNQIFGSSDECMKKITAKYTHFNHNNDLNSLLTSNRKYRNIRINFQRLQVMKPKHEQNVKAILKKFFSTIVTLDTSHDFKDIHDLPKLQELQFNNLFLKYYGKNKNYFYRNGLMEKCTNIKKLCILSPEKLDDESSKITLNAIVKMRNLKSLTINQVQIIENLQSVDYSFKLEEIDLRIKTQYNASVKFIKDHQHTLKVLKMYSIHLVDVPFILSKLPNLHTLHIRKLSSCKYANFPENFTIKTLIITALLKDSNISFVAEMLAKLRKVKYLKLYDLNWSIICAAVHSSSIESVEYQNIDQNVTEDESKVMENYDRIKFIKRSHGYDYFTS